MKNSSFLVIVVSDTLTGEVIHTFDTRMFSMNNIEHCIQDLFYSYVVDNQHGLMIKIGSSN